MSENISETLEAPETDEAPAEEAPKDWETEYLKLKSEARKWENRSKQNKSELEVLAEKAKKFEEWEASQKTDAEKAADRIKALETEARTARVELAKMKIASEKGIKPEALKLLQGETEEELTANADVLLSIFASYAKPEETPKVTPVRTQGASGSQTANSADAAWAEVWNSR